MGIDASRITAIHANILEDATAVKKQTGEPFDIAVANILAGCDHSTFRLYRRFHKTWRHLYFLWYS